MVDRANLEIKVFSDGVEVGTKRLDQLEKTSKKTEKATNGLTSAFQKFIIPLASAATAMATLNKLVDVSREFDRLNAGLITATKSSENAASAFEALQEFAANTPYDLAQAVDGFTKLVNLGLTPSEKALTSYGNTASAMGKDLMQLIEAVADASTFEFERLKEFGIKAKQEGDKVSFTFQGVTTTVKKNASEIENYLIALGENQFAGAMQQRMDSLDGSLSNLADNWDSVFREISRAGVGDMIKEQVDIANLALDELITQISSGQLGAELVAVGHKFDGFAKDAKTSLEFISSLFNDESGYWSSLLKTSVDSMSDTFGNFPENVRAFIQLMTVEILAGYDKALAYTKSFVDGTKEFFTGGTVDGVAAQLDKELKIINETRDSSIESILQERDANVASYQEQINAAQKLREEYDKNKAARELENKDRLAQYKVQGSDSTASAGVDKAAAAAQKKRETEFKKLQESLLTEEEAIQASYEKRKAIIEANTAAESTTRIDLMARLEKERQKELDDLYKVEELYEKRKRLAAEVAKIEEQGWTKAQQATAEYQTQMETLWQAQMNGVINEQEHEAAVDRVTKAYEKQQDQASGTFIDIDELGKQAAANIQDAFADFLFDPFSEGLDGMLIGFLKVLQRMAAEAAAAQLGSMVFGSSGGGGGWLSTLAGAAASYFTGGTSTAASSMAAGASQSGYSMDLSNFTPRAAGGPTVGGDLYRVNERKPEMYSEGGVDYLLGTSGGKVTPLSEASGMGTSVSVAISVTVNADGTSQESSTPDQGDASDLADSLKGVALQVVQQEMRPGGMIWNFTQGRG